MSPRPGRRRAVLAAAWLALALALSGCAGLAGGPRPELVAGADWSGLEPVDIKGIDIAAVSLATDFGKYDAIILEPIQVKFAEGWKPARPGSAFEISEREYEKLREDVAEPLRRRFVGYIEQGGKYRLTDEPGPKALRVRIRVADVRMNAPNLETAGRTEEYARSFGEMTLVAELIDSESGALVGRLVDLWIDPETRFERYTRVENDRAIGEAAEQWAESLRRHLEVSAIRNRMQGVGEGLKRVDPGT